MAVQITFVERPCGRHRSAIFESPCPNTEKAEISKPTGCQIFARSCSRFFMSGGNLQIFHFLHIRPQSVSVIEITFPDRFQVSKAAQTRLYFRLPYWPCRRVTSWRNYRYIRMFLLTHFLYLHQATEPEFFIFTNKVMIRNSSLSSKEIRPSATPIDCFFNKILSLSGIPLTPDPCSAKTLHH